MHRLPIQLWLVAACGRASLVGWNSICADGTRYKVKRCSADLAETIRGCGGRRLVPATKCTNLAVAGAASQAVNWALMLAGGLAQHVHTRTVASLLTAKDFSRNSRPKGMSGKNYRDRPRLGLNDVGMPTCFFWTLREPAKRIESGYRHAVQLMASHPLFSVRRPPPLDDLMARGAPTRPVDQKRYKKIHADPDRLSRGGIVSAGERRYKSCPSARRRWQTTGPPRPRASSAIRMRGYRRRTRGRSIATRGCEKSRRSRTRTGAGSMKRRSSRTTSSGEPCAAGGMPRPRMHRPRVDGIDFLSVSTAAAHTINTCPDATGFRASVDGSVTSRLGSSAALGTGILPPVKRAQGPAASPPRRALARASRRVNLVPRYLR